MNSEAPEVLKKRYYLDVIFFALENGEFFHRFLYLYKQKLNTMEINSIKIQDAVRRLLYRPKGKVENNDLILCAANEIVRHEGRGWQLGWKRPDGTALLSNNFKLYLRPLEDMTRDEYIEIFTEEIEPGVLIKNKRYTYEETEKMLALGFDVFNLLKTGDAIEVRKNK